MEFSITRLSYDSKIGERICIAIPIPRDREEFWRMKAFLLAHPSGLGPIWHPLAISWEVSRSGLSRTCGWTNVSWRWVTPNAFMFLGGNWRVEMGALLKIFMARFEDMWRFFQWVYWGSTDYCFNFLKTIRPPFDAKWHPFRWVSWATEHSLGHSWSHVVLIGNVDFWEMVGS